MPEYTRCSKNDDVLHDVLSYKGEPVRRKFEGYIREEQQRGKSADHVYHHDDEQSAYPVADDEQQAQYRFPDRQQDDTGFGRYQAECQLMDRVDGQFFRRTVPLEILQHAEPYIDNTDTDTQDHKGAGRN